MRAPLLDVVAVSYQARVETGRFLDSLAHIDVPFRVLIIDNASPDMGVRTAIVEHLPARSELCRSNAYVFNHENVGYARAVNQAMSLLPEPAPYAAILNTDTEFIAGESIARLIEHFEQNPDVGVIGPRTFTSGRKLTHAGIVNTPEHPRNHHRAWMLRDVPHRYRDTLDVNTVSGATYFVRRSMWDALSCCETYLASAPGAEGAFLPTRHFFEETYCSYHARAHGWRVVYLGGVAMIHQWHRSSQPGSQSFREPQEMFFAACKFHGIDMSGEVE